MIGNLFRTEALENNKSHLWGNVLLAQPVSYRLLTLCIAIIIVTIITFLMVGQYARKETVHGYIVPDKGMVKVYPLISGSINKIYAIEGQQVKEGDILASVYTGKSSISTQDTAELLVNALLEQKQLIKTNIEQEWRYFNSEKTRLQQNIQGSINEKSAIDQQIKRLETRVRLSQEQLKSATQLEQQGYASSIEVQRYKDQLLSLQSDLDSGRQRQVTIKNKINDTKALLLQLPISNDKQLTQLHTQLKQLDQQLLNVKGQAQYVIKSTVSGRIASLSIVHGQTVTPEMPIIAVLPEGAQLQGELFVPSRAAGFINKSNPVLIRYDAFPYQRFGLHKGAIINVAEAIFRPDELPVPVPLNEPVYRVKVALDNQYVHAFGKDFQLQSGMLLEADVILENRTLIEWLLDPVLSMRGRI